MPPKKFETIDALRAQIGQEVALGDWVTITQEQINLFAEATGDYQWIHVDKARAAVESPYGTTIAHGCLTLALIPRLMADTLELPPAKMLVNYGMNRVRFAAPVRCGVRVRPRIFLLGIEDVAGGLQFNWKVQIEVEDSEKPACVAEILSREY
jgi:acyl dehydratase